MSSPPAELAFRARALAQAHPLTPIARRAVDQAVARERAAQPLPELATWAGAALVNGYCLRRVEEDAAGLDLGPPEGADPVLEEIEDAAGAIAADLRAGPGGGGPADEVTVAALDRIIGSEVERRLDYWRDELDDSACAEVEEYVTWWVVRGYALRVAEMVTGAVA